MFFNIKNKIQSFFDFQILFVFFFVILIFSNTLYVKVLAITVPESISNGEYFTPICGNGAVYFDVPNLLAPQNCGDSITFGLSDGITYEIRDLDENANPIPPSAFITSYLDGYGCMDPIAENYDPGVIHDDGMCVYSNVSGCTDPIANNYNSAATNDNGSCTYSSLIPITAPPTVYNGEYFTPVCGVGVYYFDVPNLIAPQNCGDAITFGMANNITYEVRGLDINTNVVSPSVYVKSIYNIGSGVSVDNISTIHSYKPDVLISLPNAGSIFSTSMVISYQATDNNDFGSLSEKNSRGLTTKPVSIFYSDKIPYWYNQIIDPNIKTLIAKNLPASSTYKWQVQNLVPGVFYRIIVDAIDRVGLLGEMVSDFFTVDFTPPVFSIKTDPVLIKKGNVQITVEPSETLLISPIVSVTQRGGNVTLVSMSEEDGIYTGTYTVQDGFDGTAKIETSGEDLAGNIGNEIINGGTFSVGVNPPKKPIITSPQNKIVVSVATTSVSGTAREDTEVILMINGTTTQIIKPDSKGNFTFKNVILSKLKNSGLNHLSVISQDSLGSLSESANIEIKYNIAPNIFIIKPANNLLLNNTASIVTKSSDENFDSLIYSYQIISKSDFDSANQNNSWITISNDVPSGSIDYDTTEVDNGEYYIRTIVSDGYAFATSSPISVIINNTLPYFRFEDGRNTITNKSDITINGKAYVATNNTSATINNIYYSLDGGNKWTTVKIDNTTKASPQKFSVTFNGLKEGTYPILWRIQDSKNNIGRGTHVIIVDKTSPKIPIIKSPQNNAIITNDFDENLKKDALQITISGISEGSNMVSMVFNNKMITTRALPTGEFSFMSVTLDKKGEQNIQFYSTDDAGNISDVKILKLIYNNPPIITFINPKPFRGLSGKAVVSWNISDLDGNNIKNINVSYRNNGGEYKTLVSNGQANGTYTWDTTNLPQSNNYELKISANDSLTSVSNTESFVIDRTPPTLLSFNIKKEISNKKVNFTGQGTASDLVSGIEYVEFSVKADGEKDRSDWYKGIITKGYLQNQASFILNYPNELADNSYTVYARAVDVAGNVSNELSQNIVIDRTPPRIGSFFVIKNDLKLTPDLDGQISFYLNSIFTLAVSIENDTESANVVIGNQSTKLIKSISSGLWEATTTVNTEAPQDIYVTATDSSRNVTDKKKIGKIIGVNNGHVSIVSENGDEYISGVRIRVNKFNDITGHYDKYNPIVDGILSIIETDKNGRYELTLPAGKYTISAVKYGYKVIKKDIILDRVQIVNESFETKIISGIEKIYSDIVNSWFY